MVKSGITTIRDPSCGQGLNWVLHQDLYSYDQQFIYVNRGFGFMGYPGRVGILPEITILELNRA